MSGGPVFDEWGRAVAMVKGGVTISETTRFLIPLLRGEPVLERQNVPSPSACVLGEEADNSRFGQLTPEITASIKLGVDDKVIPVNYRLALGGSAFDQRTGPVPSTDLEWETETGASIGKGDGIKISNLSIGAHRIYLVATTDDGRRGVGTVEIAVVPSKPDFQLVSSLPAKNGCQALTLSDNFLAVNSGDPADPQQVASIIYAVTASGGPKPASTITTLVSPYIYSLASEGSNLFTFDSSGAVTRYDVSDPSHLRATGKSQAPDGLHGIRSIAVKDGLIGERNFDGRFALFDGTSDSVLKTIVSPAGAVGADGGLGFAGQLLALPQRYAGLDVYDISSPTSPKKVGTLSTGTDQPSTNAILDGTTVFVGSWDGSLNVVSLANPASPIQIARMPGTGNSFRIAKMGNFLLLAGVTDGLIVVDVSDPAKPTLSGASQDFGRVVDVSTNKNFAAICGEATVTLLKITP
jgi:LVIVD repeat